MDELIESTKITSEGYQADVSAMLVDDDIPALLDGRFHIAHDACTDSDSDDDGSYSLGRNILQWTSYHPAFAEKHAIRWPIVDSFYDSDVSKLMHPGLQNLQERELDLIRLLDKRYCEGRPGQGTVDARRFSPTFHKTRRTCR